MSFRIALKRLSNVLSALNSPLKVLNSNYDGIKGFGWLEASSYPGPDIERLLENSVRSQIVIISR